MQVELGHLSTTKKELLFRRWCDKRNIDCFLLDLDDTVCGTRRIFIHRTSQAADFLATNAPVLSRKRWKEAIETVNDRLFETLGVISQRWNHVIDELADQNKIPIHVRRGAKQILRRIYTTPPEMLDGAEAGLQFLRRVNMPFGIVTHANSKWTWKKYNWLGLQKYLDWNDVFIVGEHGHKTSESWVRAAQYFGLKIRRCAVAGDSPRSDINPAREAGAEHCFLVKDPTLWSIHQQPVDPSTHVIDHLGQLSEIGREELLEFRPRKTR